MVVLGHMVPGSLHESLGHEHFQSVRICVLYDSPCIPLLLLWLGEVEVTSLALYQFLGAYGAPMGSVVGASPAADGRQSMR